MSSRPVTEYRKGKYLEMNHREANGVSDAVPIRRKGQSRFQAVTEELS